MFKMCNQLRWDCIIFQQTTPYKGALDQYVWQNASGSDRQIRIRYSMKIMRYSTEKTNGKRRNTEQVDMLASS